MVFSNLTSRKYFRCLMVAEYKLNSESNAKTVYLCQNVILASNLRSLQQNARWAKGRGAVFSWIYVCSQAVLEMLYSGLFMLEEHSEGNLQYIFFRCLIVKTLHFLSLPICQSPVKRWLHSSKFWKNYWPLRIMH